jgi:ABC-2 type transport system ATP-binding protein
VHEYLDFFARAYGLRGSQRTEAVASVEEFTNVAGIREKTLRSLSKGMKQRVSLGRALVADPQVLILDEPAAGLDPRARVELRELLTLLAKQGKAILISSHILTELTEICDGVVIIEQGNLLESGNIDDVMAKRAPRRTYALRVLGEPQDLLRELLQTAHVENPRVAGAELHFEVEGGEDEAFGVLNTLIANGHRVVEFRQTKANLEDIFMNVTTGGVQ